MALARPDRTVVVFEGDGGLMMSLPELETAARERIPVVVVVLDDGAYGAETYMMEKAGLDPALSLFENPDLAQVARDLGARGDGGLDRRGAGGRPGRPGPGRRARAGPRARWTGRCGTRRSSAP